MNMLNLPWCTLPPQRSAQRKQYFNILYHAMRSTLISIRNVFRSSTIIRNVYLPVGSTEDFKLSVNLTPCKILTISGKFY